MTIHVTTEEDQNNITVGVVHRIDGFSNKTEILTTAGDNGDKMYLNVS